MEMPRPGSLLFFLLFFNLQAMSVFLFRGHPGLVERGLDTFDGLLCSLVRYLFDGAFVLFPLVVGTAGQKRKA